MKWSAAAAMLVAFAFNIWAADSLKQADCLGCHEQPAAATFQASVHGSLSCTDCHSSKKAYPHGESEPKVKCDTCHAEPASGVASSVHTSAGAQPCLGCHGEPHAILPASNPKASIYPTNLPRTCGNCHADGKFAKQHHIQEVYSPYIDSIHGFALTKDGLLVAASCSSCHGSHKILSRKDPKSRTHHANIPATCGTCHAGPKEAYLAGIHGMLLESGNNQAPVCTDCHTAHQIASVRTASWQTRTTGTCGNCHKEQFTTYRDTFHAQVSSLGYIETAHCWDCHGFHDVRPATDSASMIAKANLQTTCGKCHSNVTKGFVSYQPHADRHNRKDYPLLWASGIFMELLLAGVLGFFALHALLWLIRSIYDRRTSRLAASPGH